MNLLALDTSSNACSVALLAAGNIVEQHVVEPRQHTKLLIPMIEGVLHDADLQPGGLDAIVLGNGPGSFIGMRIAASVAQGLAYAAGLGIVPVSSLAAVAAEVMHDADDEFVAVTQDARMNEVYLGLYRRDADGLPLALTADALQAVGDINWPGDSQTKWLAAGEGWRRYPKLAEANRARLSAVAEIGVPRARYLLQLGARGESVPPDRLDPAYLRSKVAEPSR